MVMQTAETVAFEAMILMAGYLAEPSTHVAAMGITFTLCGLIFCIELGVASAFGA